MKISPDVGEVAKNSSRLKMVMPVFITFLICGLLLFLYCLYIALSLILHSSLPTLSGGIILFSLFVFSIILMSSLGITNRIFYNLYRGRIIELSWQQGKDWDISMIINPPYWNLASFITPIPHPNVIVIDQKNEEITFINLITKIYAVKDFVFIKSIEKKMLENFKPIEGISSASTTFILKFNMINHDTPTFEMEVKEKDALMWTIKLKRVFG